MAKATSARSRPASRASRKRPATPPPRSRSRAAWIGVGVVAVVVFAVVIAVSVDGNGPDEGAEEFGSPQVTGEVLPRFDPAVADPAVGMAAPAVSGADFDGAANAIEPGRAATAIVFLAHWCGFCQAEVPEVQALVSNGTLPEGVELVSVVTGTDQARDNYPPSAWLDREGWTVPVILDTEAGDVAGAYGLSAFPYWVFLDDAGTVAGRISGGISSEQLLGVLESLAS